MEKANGAVEFISPFKGVVGCIARNIVQTVATSAQPASPYQGEPEYRCGREKMVLPARIEILTSALPKIRRHFSIIR